MALIKCEECDKKISEMAKVCPKCGVPLIGSETIQVNGSVRLFDMDMPFISMVSFMVKAAIAAIPALFILFGLGFVLALILVTMGYNINI